MKRKDWKLRSAIERRFASTINQLTAKIKFIVKGKDTLGEIIAELMALADSPEWQKIAWTASLQMVKSIAVQNAQTWREAARQSGQSHEIYRLLKFEFSQSKAFSDIVSTNAELIKSMPTSVAKEVTKHVAAKAIEGLRPEALLEHIREVAPQISENRAKLIARTETAKTMAAITETRATNLGLKFYRWETSCDQRVRSSHKHMQGVICSFENPPNPEALDGKKSQFGNYGPGTVPNCRCYASPVIDPEFESFPAKMAQGNNIVSISKKQFEAMQ